MRKVLAGAAGALAVAGFASAAQAGGVVMGCDEQNQAFIATTSGIVRAGVCGGGPWVVRLAFTDMSANTSDPWYLRARIVLMNLHGPNTVPPKFSLAFKQRLDAAVAGQAVKIVPMPVSGLPAYVVTTYAAATPAGPGAPR